MGLLNSIRSMSLKMKIESSIAVIAIIVSVVLFNISRDVCLIVDMCLLCVFGVINAWYTMHAYKPAANNNHSLSGDVLRKGSDGLASAGLDNTKTVKLQNDSRAEFQKEGKRLELQLTKNAESIVVNGNMKAEKTFEIKPSTMTAGIRDISGKNCSDDVGGGRESLVVTEGIAEISAANSVTSLVEANFNKAVKDLGYDKDQDPSETPTPVPAGEKTEEDVAPPPAPVPLYDVV